MAQRNAPLRLRFAEGELTVCAQSQDVGETRESLPAAYTGDPLEIGFNAEFLREGLESVDRRHGAAEAHQPAPSGPDLRRRRRLLVPDHADPARRLIVRHARLRDVRSYARLELELEPGLVLVTGPNGAGKTNLVEAIHLATQGFSFRTRAGRAARALRRRRRHASASTATRAERRARRRGAAVSVREPKRLCAQRCAARVRRGAPPPRARARLHARPARRRQGRPGRATGLPRPLARSPAACPCRRVAELRDSRSASATPACVGSPPASPRATRSSRGRDAVADARCDARRGAVGALDAPRRPVRRARGRARPARRPARAGAAQPPTERGARGPARARSRARLDRARAAPRRDPDPARASATSARSARRESSGWRCWPSSSPRQSCWPAMTASPRCSCSTTRSPSSTPPGDGSSASGSAVVGQAIVTATGPRRCRWRRHSCSSVSPGTVRVALMERIGQDVRGALRRRRRSRRGRARRGHAGLAGRGRRRRSPGTPGRCGSRATGRCTSPSHRRRGRTSSRCSSPRSARSSRRRWGREDVPTALRFAVGPIPAPGDDPAHAPVVPATPSPDEVARRGGGRVGDRGSRAAGDRPRAAAASLAAHRSGRHL